jgi:hypothetical protein
MLKPKVKADNSGFTAEFTKTELRQIAAVILQASLCRQLNIDGGAEAEDGLQRVLVACGYAAADEGEGES